MLPDEKRSVEVEVAGLSMRVDTMQASLDKNNESTAGLRQDVTRLRSEMNGHLPRIDRNVGKLFDKLDEGQKLMHACHERTEVQANEIGTLFKIANDKAGKTANDEAHARLWFVLRLSILAIAIASVGVLVARAFEM